MEWRFARLPGLMAMALPSLSTRVLAVYRAHSARITDRMVASCPEIPVVCDNCLSRAGGLIKRFNPG